MLQGVASAFSDDIAIDLGTANTLVHVAGRGIIIDEPSAVAVRADRGTREILAVGRKAKALIGRAPESMELVRPLRDGVIADFLATEEMLRQFIKRTKTMLGFRRPRILICVPAQATPVERRAVYDTAVSVGARKVYLIAEPVAASLGAGLPIGEHGRRHGASTSAAAPPTSPCCRAASLSRRARCAWPAMPWTTRSSATCAGSIS